MIKHGLYMLYDNVSNMYVGAITLLINDNVAMRSFTELMHNPQFPYRTMASDLKLYKIGMLNIETGEVESEKKFICDLSDLVGVAEKEEK